jgi:hypothetical protein
MKHINVVFTEEELDELREVKADRTWREAILDEFGLSE